MRFVTEFREREPVQAWAAAIAARQTRPWVVMEICGGQTHAIVKYGLDSLLPPGLTLIHGPGCPVCVTAAERIDQAIALARNPEMILCSYGDMLRVPGSELSLLEARAQGADVRLVYSPLEALVLAQDHPHRQVVFFAVGFETTAPGSALLVRQAEALGVANLFLLTAHVCVPPAMAAILADPGNRVEGFLAAGHVCTVMGEAAYTALAQTYRVPIVITGFEPVDILQGLYHCVDQLEAGQAEVLNPYARAVRPAGNPVAQALLAQVFEPVDQDWRGIGRIPQSGLGLRPAYQRFDALARFADQITAAPSHPSECLSGQILLGAIKPPDCPAFGRACTPEHPLGAPMVSSEGACAAYYRYRGRPAEPVGAHSG